MSKWITDRRPTEEDADYGDVHLDGYVYVTNERGMTRTETWKAAAYHGFPWQPIVIPEPYVKPKRWNVREYFGRYYVVAGNEYDAIKGFGLHTREAAERIAAIYEEEMP